VAFCPGAATMIHIYLVRLPNICGRIFLASTTCWTRTSVHLFLNELVFHNI